MKLKVIEYNERQLYHICEDEAGSFHRVDLFVDRKLDGYDEISIIGHTVTVDHLSPYEEIACDVEVLP